MATTSTYCRIIYRMITYIYILYNNDAIKTRLYYNGVFRRRISIKYVTVFSTYQARYRHSLDPTVDDVKKLCTSLRRNAKVTITNPFSNSAFFKEHVNCYSSSSIKIKYKINSRKKGKEYVHYHIDCFRLWIHKQHNF